MGNTSHDRREIGRSLLSPEDEEWALGRRDPIDRLSGVGPRRAEAYRRLGLRTVGDLLRRLPVRYRRFEAPRPIAALVEGEPAVVRAVVRSSRPGHLGSPNRMVLEDESGRVEAVAFGPAWRSQQFAEGAEILVRGSAGRRGAARVFALSERWTEAELPAPGAAAVAPEYGLGKAIPARLHRRWLKEAFERARPRLAERRPRHLRDEDGPSQAELLEALHFPRSVEQVEAARKVLKLEEAVRWQVAILRLRRGRNRRRRAYPSLAEVEARLERGLPFALGRDQRAAIADIREDLEADRCMARLLTGDVGSGKTVVSWFPLLAAADGGRQAALLAPTELLARQHHRGLEKLAEVLDLPAPVFLGGKPRRGPMKEARRAPLLVGTHRLMSARLELEDLAAVVVDEQHKFGVRHRVQLWTKGRTPDLLTVSATPIPRTLAQSYLGYLDHSRLGARPGARRQVTTELLTGRSRASLVDRIRAELDRGGRVFVVCPAVGEAGGPSASGMPAAEEVGPWLRERVAPHELGVLHGRLDSADKAARLEAFASGRATLLVATVVIEVGVDVPDATMVAILGAERFGLSQLHQIRGRVGRRGQPAACLLVSSRPSAKTRERLERFCEIEDGEELAELDLELRGPGEVLGLAQSGEGRWSFPEALLDPDLREQARRHAERLEAAARKTRSRSQVP